MEMTSVSSVDRMPQEETVEANSDSSSWVYESTLS